jgi:transposase
MSHNAEYAAAYSAEYGYQMVEHVGAGRRPEELAREFEPTAQTIHKWVKQADLDQGRRQGGTTTSEREELARLRRENKRLWLELEILPIVAGWLARQISSIPPGSSSS